MPGYEYALARKASLAAGTLGSDNSCLYKQGAEKDKCEALDYLCGPAGTAAKGMATSVAALVDKDKSNMLC